MKGQTKEYFVTTPPVLEAAQTFQEASKAQGTLIWRLAYASLHHAIGAPVSARDANELLPLFERAARTLAQKVQEGGTREQYVAAKG